MDAGTDNGTPRLGATPIAARLAATAEAVLLDEPQALRVSM